MGNVGLIFTIHPNADCQGGNIDSITLAGSVTVNSAPIAMDQYVTTLEDTPVIVVPSATDVDGNLDLTSVTIIESPSNGGVMVNQVTGEITYTPDLDYFGPDSIEYRICDTLALCDTGLMTIQVVAVNDAPVAVDEYVTTLEDTPVTVVASVTDVDAILDLTSAVVTIEPTNGMVANNGDGSFTYTPDLNFNDTDSFTYEVCDTLELCDTATVTIGVVAGNDAPVATDNSYRTDEDTALTVGETSGVLVDDTDVDLGDTKTLTEVNGSASVVGQQITLESGALLTLNADGSFDYDPNGQFEFLQVGESETDSFSYTMEDSSRAYSIATVTITITGVNDPPTPGTVFNQFNQDGDEVSGVNAATSDIDGDTLSYRAIGLPAGLSIHTTTTGLITGTIDSSASQVNGGVYLVTVTADDGHGGTTNYQFTWTVSPLTGDTGTGDTGTGDTGTGDTGTGDTGTGDTGTGDTGTGDTGTGDTGTGDTGTGDTGTGDTGDGDTGTGDTGTGDTGTGDTGTGDTGTGAPGRYRHGRYRHGRYRHGRHGHGRHRHGRHGHGRHGHWRHGHWRHGHWRHRHGRYRHRRHRHRGWRQYTGRFGNQPQYRRQCTGRFGNGDQPQCRRQYTGRFGNGNQPQCWRQYTGRFGNGNQPQYRRQYTGRFGNGNQPQCWRQYTGRFGNGNQPQYRRQYTGRFGNGNQPQCRRQLEQ